MLGNKKSTFGASGGTTLVSRDTVIMGDIHFPSSMDFHKKWFENLKEDSLNQRFAIDTPDMARTPTLSNRLPKNSETVSVRERRK